MNKFNADSSWKYHFGQGWSKVHVEIDEAGEGHFQIVKQSFWKSVLNLILSIFHMDFKPEIEDRVFIFPYPSNQLEERIKNISKEILDLERRGFEAKNIRDSLLSYEAIASKKYFLQIKWPEPKLPSENDPLIEYPNSPPLPSLPKPKEDIAKDNGQEAPVPYLIEPPPAPPLPPPPDTSEQKIEEDEAKKGDTAASKGEEDSAATEQDVSPDSNLSEEQKAHDAEKRWGKQKVKNTIEEEEEPPSQAQEQPDTFIPETDEIEIDSLWFLNEKDAVDQLLALIRERPGEFEKEKETYLNRFYDQKLPDDNQDKVINAWVEKVLDLASGSAEMVGNPAEELKKLLKPAQDLQFEELFALLVAGYRLATLYKKEQAFDDQIVRPDKIFKNLLLDLIDENYRQFEFLTIGEFSPELHPFIFDKKRASTVSSFIQTIEAFHKRDVADRRVSGFMNAIGWTLVLAAGFGIFVAGKNTLDWLSSKPTSQPPPDISMPQADADLATLKANNLATFYSDGAHQFETIILDLKHDKSKLKEAQTQSQVDTVAAKIQQTLDEFGLLAQKGKEAQPYLETSLTRLVETAPAVPVTKELFRQTLSSAAGRSVMQTNDGQAGVTYILERLPLLGQNQEQSRNANELRNAIASYPVLRGALETIQQNLQNQAAEIVKEYETAKKEHEEEFYDESQGKPWEVEFHAKARDRIKAEWREHLDHFTSQLSHLMENSPKQGFLIPIKGDNFIHLIPEKPLSNQTPSSWTLRSYTPLGKNAYIERTGLEGSEIFSKAFLEAILLNNLQLPSGNLGSLEFGSLFPKTDVQNPLEFFFDTFPSQAFPDIYGYESQYQASLQNRLNSMVYAFLGPEALLDFQISTFKHYLDAQQQELVQDSQILVLAKHAHAALALAAEKNAEAGILTAEELQEKSRILHEIGTTLREVTIKARKVRILKTPLVSDIDHERKVAEGKIPKEGIRPLVQKNEGTTPDIQPYVPPLEIFSNDPYTHPAPGQLLTLTEVRQLAGKIQTSPQTGIPEFQAWAARILQEPKALTSLSPRDADQMLSYIGEISERLMQVQGMERAKMVSLVETVAIADHLLGTIEEGKLQGQHLPIPQLVRRLENSGLFPSETSFPQFREQVANLKSHPGVFLFDGALGDLEELNNWREFSYRGGAACPWGVRRIMEISSNESIEKSLAATAPHIAYLIGEMSNNAHTGWIVSKYNQQLSSPEHTAFKNLKKIIENVATASAHEFVSETTWFADFLKNNPDVSHPNQILDAVKTWANKINPSTIDRGTLEMLSQEQTSQLFEALGSISQSFHDANFRVGKQLPDAETMIIQLELVTLVDQLLAYSKVRQYNLYRMPLNLFEPIFRGTNLFFRTFDPQLENERLLAIKDWDYERNLKGFRRHANPRILFQEFSSFFGPAYSLDLDYGDRLNPAVEFPFLMSGGKILQEVSGSTIRDPRNFDIHDLEDRNGPLDGQYRDCTRESVTKMGVEAFLNPDFVFPGPGGETAPKWYYAIRDLTYSAIHTLRSGYLNPVGEAAPSDFFHPVHSKYYTSIFDFTPEVQTQLKGVSPDLLNSNPDIPDGHNKGHFFAHLEPTIEQSGILKEIREQQLESPPTKPMLSRRERFGLNMAMAQDFESRRGNLSTEEARLKWSLRGEKSLQAFSTIYTYMDHPDWLTQPAEQVEFLNLLFDPQLYWDHLLDPAGLKTEENLAKFLRAQFKIHRENKEIQLFLTEVGVRLAQYGAFARDSAPKFFEGHPLPPELVEFSQLPSSKIAKMGTASDEKGAYGALNCLNFIGHTQLNKEEVVTFLSGALAYNAFDPVKMVNARVTERQIEGMFKRFEKDIYAALYPEGKLDTDVVENILSHIAPGKGSSLLPSANNPLILSDQAGTYELNLLQGTLFEKGRESVALPTEAKLSSDYLAVHGQNSLRGKALDKNTYRFEDSLGFTNFIQHGSDKRWHLYRQLDSGDLFQLVSKQWSSRAFGNTTSVKWLQSDWLLTQFTHWHRSTPKPEIRLLDREGRLAYRIDLKGKEELEIEKITQIDANGKEYVLADINQASLAWTQQFEDPHLTHVWLEAGTNEPHHLEYPRLGTDGLRFSWGSGRWNYDAAPQYFLVPRQIHPLFHDQTNFLYLKTSLGEERILTPRHKPMSGDTPSSEIEFDRDVKNLSPQRLLTFNKNQKTGNFEGETREANLYLAMMQYAQRENQEAHRILVELLQDTSPLEKEEAEILDWIIRDKGLPANPTPQSIAIRTLAAHLLARNAELNSTPSNIPYSVPDELLRQYLNNIDKLGDLRLPIAEEGLLFRNSLKHGSDLPIDVVLTTLQLTDPVQARRTLDSALKSLIYKRSTDKTAELKFQIDTSTLPISGTLVPELPSVITPEELKSLIITESAQKIQEGLPEPIQKIFDYDRPFKGKPLEKATIEFLKGFEKGALQYQTVRGKNHYILRDQEAFTAKRIQLENSQKQRTLEMERLRLKILQMANPVPNEPSKAQQLTLQLEAGTKKFVTFEELVEAYAKNNLRLYRELNEKLSFEQAEKIDQELQVFIDTVPQWEHVNKLIETMQEVENTKGQQDALKSFIQVAEAGRKIPHDALRSMKVLEYETGTYYRGAQVTNLGQLGIPNLSKETKSKLTSAVHNIAVGAGKTSRLLPTLMRQFAEDGKLALAIMPEAQLSSAGAEFSHIMQEVYGVKTLTLKFERSQAKPDDLAKMREKIEKAIIKGRPVLTSGKDLRVLRNLFIEKTHQYVRNIATGNVLESDLKTVLELQKIVNLLSTKPVIDEIHKEYETKVETNHPIGKPESINKVYGVITLNLYEILNGNETIHSLMHFNYSPAQREKGALPFSPERFTSQVAPILVDEFFKILNNFNPQNPDVKDPELASLANFYQHLTVEQTAYLREYLLKQNKIPFEQWMHTQKITGLGETVREQLDLVRGEINVLMPNTLNRQFGKNYGFENPDDIVPIPFSAAGSPNKGSQHSSPFVRMNYLVQALFREGPRQKMVDRLVQQLKKDRLTELNTLSEEALSLDARIETAADREFQGYFQAPELNLDTPNLEKILLSRISENPQLFRHLIKTFALPLVKVYPKNLKATSQHLGNIFEEGWIGFSGTPNNYPTYPGNFEKPKNEMVVGRMLTLINEHAIGHTHTVDLAPKDVLTSSYCAKASAFMDAAGIFATENLEELTDKWGEQTGKSPVRIDPEKGIVIKQNPSDRAVPLRTVNVPPKSRVTLYDEPHVVGTDITQPSGGIGILSAGEDITATKLDQAGGRMRDIENTQKIELLLLSDAAFIIKEALGLPPEHQLTSAEVTFYALVNESEELKGDSETALNHKLQAVIDNYIYNWLKKADLEEIAKKEGVQALIESVFMPEVNYSPTALFGSEEQMLPREVVFANLIQKLLDEKSPVVKSIETVFHQQAESIIKLLRTNMQEEVDRNIQYVREKLTGRSFDLDQSQEVVQEETTEVQQQQEQELKVEILQTKVETSKTTAEPLPPHPWSPLNEIIMTSWDFWQARGSPFTSGPARFMSLPSVFNAGKKTSILNDLFDVRLRVTSNFQQEVPLEGPQKPVQFVSVVRNKSTNEINLSFLDPWETALFKQNLNQNQGIVSHSQDVENQFLNVVSFYPAAEKDPWGTSGSADVWIGDLSGHALFGADEIAHQKHPEFLKLWLQAQVFAGKIDFADQERVVIKEWLKEWAVKKADQIKKPLDEILNQAENALLALHAAQEDKLERYDQSDLGKIFNELRLKK